MIQRPRVLFIARWFPVRMDSMLGLFVVRHARAVQYYADVTVINAVADINLKNVVFEKEIKSEQGIPSIIIYFKKSNFSLVNFFRNVIAYFKAFNYYNAENGVPDITHVHVLSRTAILAVYLKLFYKIPYLVSEHWSRYFPQNVQKGSYNGFFRKQFTELAVSNAYAITTVTENLKTAMQMVGLKNKRAYIIPNAIDTNKFTFRKNENNFPKVILHVSCFEEVSKNIKGLINATEELLKKRNDFELWLVGDGINKKEIEKYAAAKNLPAGKIIFKGLLEGDEIVNVMQNSTFQVLFSNYESQPSVILESFACGVPFVATAVGGIPEIMDDSRGILIEAGNEKQLTEAMARMLDDYIKYDAIELQNYARNQFNYPVIGKQFYDIYIKMLSNK